MRYSSGGNALLLIVLVPVLAIAQTPQTYSDVREIEESGDVVGTELTLEIVGEAVTGTLRHYEGAEAEPIAIAGRLVGSALTLGGSYSEGKVQIIARLEKNRLAGKLSYHLNGQTNDVELNLPRIDRPRKQKTSTGAASCYSRRPPSPRPQIVRSLQARDGLCRLWAAVASHR